MTVGPVMEDPPFVWAARAGCHKVVFCLLWRRRPTPATHSRRECVDLAAASGAFFCAGTLRLQRVSRFFCEIRPEGLANNHLDRDAESSAK